MTDLKPTLADTIRDRLWSVVDTDVTEGVADDVLDWFADYVQRDDVAETVAKALPGCVHICCAKERGIVARAALAALVETMRGEPDE